MIAMIIRLFLAAVLSLPIVPPWAWLEWDAPSMPVEGYFIYLKRRPFVEPQPRRIFRRARVTNRLRCALRRIDPHFGINYAVATSFIDGGRIESVRTDNVVFIWLWSDNETRLDR